MLKSLKWLLGGTVLILITLGITQAVKDTRAFNELKLSDPEQYLAILKEKDETQWLVALKDLNSEQYAAELKARVEIARKIPASKIDENLKAYRDLAKLEPSNETFADKVEFYKSKKTAIEAQEAKEAEAIKEARKAEKAKLKICDSKRKSDAYIYAKEAVKTQLKSPRSAKFGSYGQTRISTYKDCIFEISGHVDSQNGFGALIRSNYTVQLQGIEKGWTIKKVRIQ